MFAPVYLDANATTPLDARVLESMLPFLSGRCGNPSSRHEYGRATRDAIERARGQVAMLVGAHASEIVFTSGGSEADNLFLKGVAARLTPATVAIGATEHPGVRQPAMQLRTQGWNVVELPLNADGALDVPAAQEQIAREAPRLVSVMLANNETGALNDVAALAAGVREAGGWLHTDAVQALGKIPLDFRALGVHAMSLSAHKVAGPLGAGALVVDKRVDLQPLIAGGGQERGLRSGTENVAAIVGFGRACELLLEERGARIAAMRQLQLRLEDGLRGMGAILFGTRAARLPNTSFFAFARIDGETLVGKLDRAGFAIASGSACSSADPEPSHTLLAMGVAPELARCAVRVSLSDKTTDQEIELFLAALGQTVQELQRLTAVAV